MRHCGFRKLGRLVKVPKFVCEMYCVSSITCVELPKDHCDAALDRVLGDEQMLTDYLVCVALRNKLQDFEVLFS